MYALYCSQPSVGLHCLLAHYIINSTNLREDLLNRICLFRFSLQIFSETFLILRRTEPGIVIRISIFSRKLLVFFSEFIHTWICRQNFEVLIYKILWNFVQSEPRSAKGTDRRTDCRTDTPNEANICLSVSCECLCRQIEWTDRQKKVVTFCRSAVHLQTPVGF